MRFQIGEGEDRHEPTFALANPQYMCVTENAKDIEEYEYCSFVTQQPPSTRNCAS